MSGVAELQAAHDALKASYEELYDDHYGLRVMHRALKEELARTGRNRDMWKGQCERQAEELSRWRLRTTRESLARHLAALDGIRLQDIRSTVGPAEDANNWREYLGRADDLLAFISADMAP